MAILSGADYDHVDLQNNLLGGDITRHMFKDAKARNDISKLKSAITNLDETEIDYITNSVNPSGFINGYFAVGSGTSSTSSNFCRTITYLPVNAGDSVHLPKSNTYRYSVVAFSSGSPSYANNISNSGIFVWGYYAEVGEDYTFTAQNGEYYFISCDIPYDYNEGGPTSTPDKPKAISALGQKFAALEAEDTRLDGKIDAISDDVDARISAIGKTETLQTDHWASGGLTTAMTSTATDSTHARIQGAYLYQLPADGVLSVSIPDDLEGRVAVYSQKSFASLVAAVSEGATIPAYVSGEVLIPAQYNGLYLGLDVRKIAGGDFTAAEIEALGGRITITLTSVIGDMSALVTNNKRTIVEAINEAAESVGGMETRLPESVIDWSLYATKAAPTGWVMGSWTNEGAHSTGAGNAMHLVKKLTSSDLTGTSKIKIEYGPYGSASITCSVRVFLASAPTVLYKRYNFYESGGELEIDPELDALYAINLAGFGTAAQTAIDTGYVDSIVITKIMQAAPAATKRARTRASDYFYVQINPAYPTGNADSEGAVNVDCVLRLPETYTPTGTPTRLIFMHHGNTGTVSVDEETWYPQPKGWRNFVAAYLNAGYAVFDVNGAGPVTDENAGHDYASFKALLAAYKAYQYIKKRYNISDRIFVHGSSMGGATAYAFAKQFGGIVDAVGLFSPARLSASALKESLETYIAYNYGYADKAAMIADDYKRLIPSTPCIHYRDANGIVVYKPYTYNWVSDSQTDGLTLECKDFNIPVKIWCGSADESVEPKYGEKLAEAIINGGGFALFREIEGGTHSAGMGSNSTVNAEAVMWFNRFR